MTRRGSDQLSRVSQPSRILKRRAGCLVLRLVRRHYRHVVVDLGRFDLVEGRFVTTLTEDELESLPDWDD